MKSVIALTAAVAAVAFAAPVFAATDASVGYSNFDVGSSNLHALNGRVGWNSADADSGKGELGFGVEGEAAIGLGNDTSGTGASRTSSKLSSEFGVFGTMTAAPSENFSVFGRLGYANVDAKSTTGTGTTATRHSESEGGVAYGAGANFKFDGANGVRFDYTHYDTDFGKAAATTTTPAVKGQDANVWSLGLVHSFK